MQKKHFAIIGGGLAGSFLAARLIKAGQTVSLFDEAHPQSASQVAAGLFNVITGRFGAKSWMADVLLPELRSFFDQAVFRELFQWIHFSEIYRPFRTIEEYNKWLGRVDEEGYRHLVRFEESPLFPNRIHNPYGGIMIEPCGWLEIGPFLTTLKDILSRIGELTVYPHFVPYDKIDIEERSIHWEGINCEFDEIVFCEGFFATENPFFSKLPIIPNKGELLQVACKKLDLPWVLSRKVYMIPQGGDRYLVGSTYRNSFKSLEPTEEGKAEICQHLSKAISLPFEVVGQIAGVRPTTPDRKPILGSSSTHSHSHVFTGFGTKGVLLAPHFSTIMSNYLLRDEDILPVEVQLSRFDKK